MSARVDSAIEVHPLAPDFDIGLVNSPGIVGLLQERADAFIDLRCIMLNPTIDRRMVHRQSAFRHHFLQVSVAERITQIPSDAKQAYFWLEVTPFERVFHVIAYRVE